MSQEQSTKVSAIVCVRRQHSKRGQNSRFGGPDTYVAVQVIPEGSSPLYNLNRSAAAHRGISIIYCGEGYSEYRGPRSSLGQAIRSAKEIADRINATGSVADMAKGESECL